MTLAQFRGPAGPAGAPPREAEPPSPTVFVRTISTPPGLPWDQARIADLDARARAPLPVSELVYRVGRLEPWRPGRPSRYFACYVRAREVGERLNATAMVDGAPVAIEFLSRAERDRRLKRMTLLAGAAAATVLVTGAALVSALGVRSEATQRMDQIQVSTAARLRQALLIASLKAQTVALNTAAVHGQTIDDYLADLAWVARSKAPDAHIDAVHWDHGYMGVETRGEVAPFAAAQAGDRPVLKAAKPVRLGVWLWGVGPAARRP